MRQKEMPSRPRSRSTPVRHREKNFASTGFIGLIGTLIVGVVLGVGVLLIGRPAMRTTATRLDNAIGAASASVVVDEWSDFE